MEEIKWREGWRMELWWGKWSKGSRKGKKEEDGRKERIEEEKEGGHSNKMWAKILASM